MENRIKKYIEETHMFSPGDRIVLGLSGGADSVCLFFVLLEMAEEMDFSLFCVHVNHGIRGEDAKADEAFVKALCMSCQTGCRSYFFDIKGIAKQRGISEEEAGRNVRYAAFREVKKELGYTKIAVAHHMADQAETVLYHLCRGSGLSGMTGIRPVMGDIVRPLLCVDKNMIEEWLLSKGISWRIDKSNLTGDYMRNRIRNEIIPILEKKVNSRAVKHIAACAEALSEAEVYIKKQGRRAYENLAENSKKGISFSVEELLKEDRVIQKEIFWIAIEKMAGGRKDFVAAHVNGICSLLEKGVGREITLPGGLYAVREYEKLLITDRKDMPAEYNKQCSGIKLVLSPVMDKSEVDLEEIKKIPENAYTKWFDYDRIKDTLRLRKRKEGDYLEVFGNQGKKKLKKFFIDEKIPKEERNDIWLLADGSHVWWVIGYRISDGVKITEKTKRVIKAVIQIEKDEDGGHADGRQDQSFIKRRRS